jgi:hypothetical protein
MVHPETFKQLARLWEVESAAESGASKPDNGVLPADVANGASKTARSVSRFHVFFFVEEGLRLNIANVVIIEQRRFGCH